MVILDFFGGYSVNMQSPAALYQDHALVDFMPEGGFYSDPDTGDGADAPFVLHNAIDDAQIWLWGAFSYDPELTATGGDIEEIDIYNAADLATDPSLPDTYRMYLVFSTPVDLFDFNDALLAGDLSPLYAGQALDIRGDELNDTLVGGSLADDITGFGGADKLMGNGGNDTLDGYSGNDNLLGGTGADRLAGDTGKDTMTGNAGKDLFVFETAAGTANVDLIKDFTHGDDKIVFENSIFTKLQAVAGALAAGAFKAATNITASGGSTVDASDRILYDTDSGSLYYDSNGSASGGRVLLGTVNDDLNSSTHHPTLVAGDFKVI
jgi:Ca2+-binding RTX toxin-like protein